MSWIPPISTAPTRRAIALGALSLLLLAPPVARAGQLLDYTPGLPSITALNGTLAYNASTGDFSSTSTAAFIVTSSDFGFFDDSSMLNIDLIVKKDGDFVSNGTGLVLTGSVMVDGQAYTGDASSPLLSGVITAFGSQVAGPPSLSFDGFFTVQGGAMSGLFGVGSTSAFLLEAESVTSGILGDYQADFSSDSVKATVSTVTPEPATATLALIAAAVGGGAWLRKRLGRRG